MPIPLYTVGMLLRLQYVNKHSVFAIKSTKVEKNIFSGMFALDPVVKHKKNRKRAGRTQMSQIVHKYSRATTELHW